MTDSILDRYTDRHAPGKAHKRREELAASSEQPVVAIEDTEDSDDLGCFGWLRGVRDRALMLELRKKDGSVLAIAYAYIERVEFDPSDGITIHALGRTLRITGRNLNTEARPDTLRGVRLFEGITRHRVAWVREGGRGEVAEDRPDEPVVESVA